MHLILKSVLKFIIRNIIPNTNMEFIEILQHSITIEICYRSVEEFPSQTFPEIPLCND